MNRAGAFNKKLEFSAAVEMGRRDESETLRSPEAEIGRDKRLLGVSEMTADEENPPAVPADLSQCG
jgi:hypothetical protein